MISYLYSEYLAKLDIPLQIQCLDENAKKEWTPKTVLILKTSRNIHEQAVWCGNECNHRFRKEKNSFFFEHDSDALAFKLRWS